MTLDELRQYCEQEFVNIDRVMKELFSLYQSEKSEYPLTEQAAVAAFVVNVYGGVENILKQMLIYDKLDVQDSPEWHEKVLKKASEIGILTPDLFQVFSSYLSFRNYFLYTYIFDMKWENMKTLLDALQGVVEKFRNEVREYIQTI